MRIDVYGLGNALIDAVVVGDDRPILARHALRRGTMLLVDNEKWHQVYDEVRGEGVELHPGGSASNAICTVAALGGKAGFCGLVGDDELGRRYSESLTALLGEHDLVHYADRSTGKCLSLVSSEDAERTMLTDLGTAMSLPPDELPSTRLEASEWFFLTGYLFTGDRMPETAWRALALAKAAGVRVAFDVADAFVIEHCRAAVDRVIDEYADVVFLNEAEGELLIGGGPRKILDGLQTRTGVVALKQGKRGSLIRAGETTISIDAVRACAVDTTGAGDSYAGGFLFGLARDWDLERCGRLASAVAALTVSQVGGVVRDSGALRALL
jgi:sugar/nucleoside kinase (ribokinase family)